MGESERDKWLKKRIPFLLIVLIGVVSVIACIVWVFDWWFNRTIGSSDDWSGVWVFGLGVFVVFLIWNLLD
jgi:hypothetical protein